MNYRKKVQFTHIQKQDRKPHKETQQYAAFKRTTEESDSMDEEELTQISLEEALMKVEKIMVQIKELEEMKKKVTSNKTMTEISKKLRCKPINEKIKEHRRHLHRYEKVRAKHLGILDKLPKDSPLYSFAFNCQFAQKMQKVALKEIEAEQQ